MTKISERSEKLLEQHFFRCSLWNLDTLSEGLLEMQDLHFLFVYLFFFFFQLRSLCRECCSVELAALEDYPALLGVHRELLNDDYSW